MVAGVGAGERAVFERNSGEVVDERIGGDVDARFGIFEEAVQGKGAADRAALGIRSGDGDGVVSGSVQIVNGEHWHHFRLTAMLPSLCRDLVRMR